MIVIVVKCVKIGCIRIQEYRLEIQSALIMPI